jgi:hypothetical protein
MKISTHALEPLEKDSDVSMHRHSRKESTQGDFMRPISRLFGLLSTLVLVALALAPDTFNVSLGLRPWIFITSIFWFFAFCAGMFNL